MRRLISVGIIVVILTIMLTPVLASAASLYSVKSIYYSRLGVTVSGYVYAYETPYRDHREVKLSVWVYTTTYTKFTIQAFVAMWSEYTTRRDEVLYRGYLNQDSITPDNDPWYFTISLKEQTDQTDIDRPGWALAYVAVERVQYWHLNDIEFTGATPQIRETWPLIRIPGLSSMLHTFQQLPAIYH